MYITGLRIHGVFNTHFNLQQIIRLCVVNYAAVYFSTWTPLLLNGRRINGFGFFFPSMTYLPVYFLTVNTKSVRINEWFIGRIIFFFFFTKLVRTYLSYLSASHKLIPLLRYTLRYNYYCSSLSICCCHVCEFSSLHLNASNRYNFFFFL